MSLAKDPKALKDYYANCGIPKGATRADIKDQNDRRALDEHRAMVQRIMQFWRYRCAAYKVSPVCTKRATDPHELVRRSQGGQVSLDNSVASCRACHSEADAKVGGNRLDYDWPGKVDGKPPVGASRIQGAVWPVWTARKRGKGAAAATAVEAKPDRP